MGRAGFGLAAMAFAAAVWAAPVHAADMAVPAYNPPPAPLPPAMYNWTGIYLGANIGAGMLLDDWTQSAATGTTTFPSSVRVNPLGVVGGAQAGADVQFRALVLGVQGAWFDSDITGNNLAGNLASTVAGASQERLTSAALWFADATARIGVADDAWLFYVKGGGAWMSAKYTEDLLSVGGANLGTQGLSDTRSGFTAGGGVEFGLTEHFSAFLEYDFFDFGSKNYNFTLITPVSIHSNLNMVAFGLNYRFNGAAWH